MSLTWGMFDITGGDADWQARRPTRTTSLSLFVEGALDYA